MSAAEPSCRVCGRIQLPYSQGGIPGEVGLGRIFACGTIIVLFAAVIVWLFVRLGG